jgi:exonuclease III
MTETYRIGTLNINEIATETRVHMLETSLHRQQIDILPVQEVTSDIFKNIRGYEAYMNIGTNERGTAIMTKEPIRLTEITTLPSGRGLAAVYNGIGLINIYAPSGVENKQERKRFYNTEVFGLFSPNPEPLIIGGDFNSVLTATDCTGAPNYSEGLEHMITGLGLFDAWNGTTQRSIYTHYKPHGAARLDRLYMPKNLSSQKTGVETLIAPFTDHLAVILRITLQAPLARRGRGSWKINNELLRDRTMKQELASKMSGLTEHKHR